LTLSLPAYRVTLKAPGTPTASTANACAATTVNNQYQINSTAKRIWARNVAPTNLLDSNSSAISSTDLTDVDYLFGKVTFASSHGSTVYVDVTHLPLSAVAGAQSLTLSGTRDLLDDTDFTSTGFRSRTPGLMDISLTISRWDALDQEWAKRLLSSEVNSTSLSTGSNELVVEIRPESTGKYAVGYFRLETEALSGDVGGLEQSDLTLQLDDEPGVAAFKWSDQ